MRHADNPRFYFSGAIALDEAGGCVVELSAEESHHLLRVLRMRAGDSADVFDSDGNGFDAEVAGAERGIARLRIIAPHPAQAAPRAPLHLAVAVIKRRGMDLMIEKLSELGVDSLQPLITERSVAGHDMKAEDDPPERWERLAVAAAKQCGRNRPLRTLQPRKLADWLKETRAGEGRRAFAHFAEGAPTLGRWLRSGEEKTGIDRAIWIAIGPEGGWTDAEALAFAGAGFQPVVLGDLTLRAETAALAAAAAVRLL